MISDDDKTPSVITAGAENGRTPLPIRTPPPVKTPRPSLALKKPPLGRPAGAVSVAEMVEQITKEVRRAATAELERKHADLRAEIAAEIKTATGLRIAAIVTNALAIIAVITTLVVSRVLPARGLGLALAALTAVLIGAVRWGVRRGSAAR